MTILAPPFSALLSQLTQSRTPHELMRSISETSMTASAAAAQLVGQRAELVVLVDDPSRA